MTDVVDILMCAPEHYDVRYEINPWMAGNIGKVNIQEARKQWHGLYSALSAIPDVSIELIGAQHAAPDMVFTANAGLVLEDQIVLSRFYYPERQVEEPYFQHWFETRGYDVMLLPMDVPFEGEGDALFDTTPQRRLWCGYGFRSVQAASSIVAQAFNLDVLTLELVDPHYYHLDTCFCPLTGGYLMYYPAAFSDEGQSLIEAHFPIERRIVVEQADAWTFACNAVNIGHTIVLNDTRDQLDHELRERGFDVIHTPLTEFIQAGGAAKCLTLFI